MGPFLWRAVKKPRWLIREVSCDSLLSELSFILNNEGNDNDFILNHLIALESELFIVATLLRTMLDSDSCLSHDVSLINHY